MYSRNVLLGRHRLCVMCCRHVLDRPDKLVYTLSVRSNDIYYRQHVIESMY